MQALGGRRAQILRPLSSLYKVFWGEGGEAKATRRITSSQGIGKDSWRLDPTDGLQEAVG
jgi:hypothetical protein